MKNKENIIRYKKNTKILWKSIARNTKLLNNIYKITKGKMASAVLVIRNGYTIIDTNTLIYFIFSFFYQSKQNHNSKLRPRQNNPESSNSEVERNPLPSKLKFHQQREQ